MLADGLRTVTIALWGVLLAQGFWTIWYATKIRRLRTKLLRRHIAFFSVFWHVLILVSSLLAMGTEISWKIIFNGVGKTGVGPWTGPNVAIYLLADIGLFLVLRLERDRYVKTKIRLRLIELRGEDESQQSEGATGQDVDSKD